MAFLSRPLRPDDIECQRGLPAPRYQPGAVVRTVIRDTDGCVVATEVVGPVASYGWHWKRSSWVYKLAVPGRRRGRWYLERQFVPAGVAAGRAELSAAPDPARG
jgi:hypothetical protein